MASEQDKTNEPTQEALKKLEQCLREVDEYSKRIAERLAEIENLLAKARESQAKTDNEALRANQAKLIVEDHSNKVAQIKGAIEADASAINTKKAEIENLVATISSSRTKVEAEVTAIDIAKKSIEETNKSLAGLAGKATSQQSSVEQTKKDVEAIAQEVRERTKNIDADLKVVSTNKTTSDTLVASAQKTVTTIGELHERTKTLLETIASREDESKNRLGEVVSYVKQLQDAEKKASQHELKLSYFEEEYHKAWEKIEKLVPGATSALLASSFCIQKKRFKWPKLAWFVIFVVCMISLLLVGLLGNGWSFSQHSTSNWDEILRQLVSRLPIILPLVWLGIYSGRQYIQLERMEEEYAFKEAMSSAFEGYKREMLSIVPNEAGKESAINTLCENVLASLARRPGLIYEGKQQDVTPLNALSESINNIAPSLKVLSDSKGLPKSD